jgi:hypothetical protein
MLLVRYLVLILAFFATFLEVSAQISPPGLDDTRTVAWGAIGFSQRIGTKWQTSFYVGASRESNPDNYSLLAKPAISVIDINQQYRFNEHWQLAGCVSYRRQERYSDDPPYELNNPGMRDEIRYYMRLYYRHKINRVLFTYSFRPEYRTYFNHFHHWDPIPYDYRFRLKAQAALPLNESSSSQFVVGNEILSVARPHFTNYRYTEDRLTTYFRHTFDRPRLITDVGFMYQFLAGEGLITHFAFDLIFVDPFGKPKN